MLDLRPALLSTRLERVLHIPALLDQRTDRLLHTLGFLLHGNLLRGSFILGKIVKGGALIFRGSTSLRGGRSGSENFRYKGGLFFEDR
jgi:hypothetical protein